MRSGLIGSTTLVAIASWLALSATPSAGQSPSSPPSGAQQGGEVDSDAVDALKEMSAYLAKFNSEEIHAETTRDLVAQNGQRVQITGVSDYKLRRPNAFRIDVKTDYRNRQFYYDGKQFTIYAPDLGYYAAIAAPPTILQTIDLVEARYGVDLPLDDLFRWNEPSGAQVQQLSSAFYLGPATIDGVATDHYAFRQKDGKTDWEIWIQQGDQPLPRKLVIVDRTDEARPTYTARLSWNLNPSLSPDAFTFRPGADTKQIRLATLEQ